MDAPRRHARMHTHTHKHTHTHRKKLELCAFECGCLCFGPALRPSLNPAPLRDALPPPSPPPPDDKMKYYENLAEMYVGDDVR